MKTYEVEFSDKKKRFLTFNNKSLLEIEDKLGEPLLVVLSDKAKMTSIKTINVLLWAGLQTEYKLTYDEVIEIVPMDDFFKLSDVLGDALFYSLGLDNLIYLSPQWHHPLLHISFLV